MPIDHPPKALLHSRHVAEPSGEVTMPHVVTEPCIKCKFTDCVSVCPVDCYREGANFLVIDPDECIDCGACVPECPVKAIFPDDKIPDKWGEYVELNRKYAKEWPTITEKKEPLPAAEEFKNMGGKRHLLDPAPFRP
jgi:ferredoxin